MKVKDLCKALSNLNPEAEVMVMDGWKVKHLNFGPIYHRVTEVNAKNSSDCRDKVGRLVVLVGPSSGLNP